MNARILAAHQLIADELELYDLEHAVGHVVVIPRADWPRYDKLRAALRKLAELVREEGDCAAR